MESLTAICRKDLLGAMRIFLLERKGENKLGVKAEIKNMNSFKGVQKALAYEITRQIRLLSSGKEVVQETRLWDANEEKTYPMRSKEEAHDYRYFPEPDLPYVSIGSEYIDNIRQEMPELPDAKIERYTSVFGLPRYDAFVLTSDKSIAEYFEECAALYENHKNLSNWIMGSLLKYLNDQNIPISNISVSPEEFVLLLKIVDAGTISLRSAKDVFMDMLSTGKGPEQIIDEKGLTQISNADELDSLVETVISNNPKSVEDYKGGQEKALGHLMGQVMKATKGKANPSVVSEMLKNKLK